MLKLISVTVMFMCSLEACNMPRLRPDLPARIASSEVPTQPEDNKTDPIAENKSANEMRPEAESADAMPAVPEAPKFPYVIEFPKESFPRSTPVAGEDNSCQFLSAATQNGNRLRLSYNMLGSTLPPGSRASGGLAVSDSARCFVWGRINNISAGHRMSLSYVTDSELHALSNMKAFVAGSIENGIPDVGSFGRYATTIQYHAPNAAAANGVWYDERISFQRPNMTFPIDTSAANPTLIPMSAIGQVFAPLEVDTCPTANHDFIFSINTTNAGVSARIADTASPAVPDGFTYSFFMRELPEVTFSLSKCN